MERMPCNSSDFANFTGFIVQNCAGESGIDSVLNSLYFVGYGLVMNVLILAGTVGNVVSICVFLSPKIWACLNYYIIALALWDTALLISSLAQWSFWSLFFHGSPKLIGAHAYTLRYGYICGNTTLTGCVWVIVTLTIERFLAIIRPLKHRAMDNSVRAKVLLAAVSCAAILYNVPSLFEIEVIEKKLLCCNTISLEPFVQPTHLRSNKLYFTLYRILGSTVFIYLVPSVTLTVLTVRMCLSLRNANKFRNDLTLNRRETSPFLKFKSRKSAIGAIIVGAKRKALKSRSIATNQSFSTNRMLSVVIIKFLLCYTLPVVMDMLEIFLSVTDFESQYVEGLIIVSNCLVVLNSTCNFFIYFTGGRRFRSELSRMIAPLWECFRFIFGKNIEHSRKKYSFQTNRAKTILVKDQVALHKDPLVIAIYQFGSGAVVFLVQTTTESEV